MELSRPRAKGAQLITNLVTFAWAPFHSIKTSGLNFRQLPCSTVWNSIFAIYTQIFENYHREVFFPHSNLLPNVPYSPRFFLGRRFLGRRFLGRCFLGGRFLGRCFLGRRFLGRRFLGRRFLGRRSLFSRSSFSRHPS